MSKIDELRAELLERQRRADQSYQRAKAELAFAQTEIDLAATALDAHDRAVAALREETPEQAVDMSILAPVGRAPRRNIEALAFAALTDEPQLLDALVQKIDNVRAPQVEAALKRLVEAGKAAPDFSGRGFVRVPESADA